MSSHPLMFVSVCYFQKLDKSENLMYFDKVEQMMMNMAGPGKVLTLLLLQLLIAALPESHWLAPLSLIS